jgi:hypothetical protein
MSPFQSDEKSLWIPNFGEISRVGKTMVDVFASNG